MNVMAREVFRTARREPSYDSPLSRSYRPQLVDKASRDTAQNDADRPYIHFAKRNEHWYAYPLGFLTHRAQERTMRLTTRTRGGWSLVMAITIVTGSVLPVGCAAPKPKNYARPIIKAEARTGEDAPAKPTRSRPTKPAPAAATDESDAPADSTPRRAETPANTARSSQTDWTNQVLRTQLREKAIDALAAGTSSPSPEQRANSLEGLLLVPTRLEPIVRAALADESAAVRAVAAALVGKAGLASSTSFVQPLLNDPVVFVRASALYSLRKSGRNIDITPFAQFLEDPSPRVRAHAGFLLGELGDTSATTMLKEAAADPMPRASVAEVRIAQLQLAEARVKLGDETAIHECRAALFPARNEDLEATALAAQIAGEIEDRTSINQLINLTALKDGAGRTMPPEVRLAAAGSLAKLGLPKGAFIAREYSRNQTTALRAQSAYVFGQTGQLENLSDLEAMLNDENGIVRIAAAAAIVKITSRAP